MSVGVIPPVDGLAARNGSLTAGLLITLTNSPNDLPRMRPTSLDIQLMMRVGPVLFVLAACPEMPAFPGRHTSDAVPCAKGSACEEAAKLCAMRAASANRS